MGQKVAGTATESGPAIVNNTTLVRIDAPNYYASSIQMITNALDVTIVFGRNHPGVMNVDDQQQFVFATEAQAILHLSPQTAKELALILDEQIKILEAEVGPIRTPMTMARERG